MNKTIAAIVAVPALILLWAEAAFATADSATVAAVTDAGTDVKDTGIAIATAVLPFAAAFLGLYMGWRLVKRFVR